MIYNIIAVVGSILVPCIILIKPLMETKKEKLNFKNNKMLLLTYAVLVIGFLIRSVAIDAYPRGLNVDEASAGYDAYSILKYGIDRNGNHMPVFLEAWGSGQNVLYSYLMIPFIKLFGLNIITTRIPMVMISCTSLIVWYYLLKNIKNEKFAFIGLVFLVMCPWHVMKSRWGLESNIFPDLVLYAVFFLVLYIKNRKPQHLYIAFAILGMTGYAYGTSYFFLPIFCLISYIYLLATKKAKFRNILISFLIIFIIALPIMLYVIINTFGLEQISLGFITIPKLPVNRYEQQTSLFEGNILKNAFDNFEESSKLLIMQDDECPWNMIRGFGIYYIFSIPLLIIGLIFGLKKNKQEEKDYYVIMNIWFIASFLLLFVFKEANINRINILIFPLIYYIVNSIYLIFDMKYTIINVAITTLYLAFFIFFEVSYFQKVNNKNMVFTDKVSDVIEYVNSLENIDNIYFGYHFKEPYIYVLYYTRYNTNDFIDTVQYFDSENLGRFDNVKSFGKYKFYLPKDNQKYDNENNVYVVKKEDDLEIDDNQYTVKEFEKYVVVEKKR